jgi:hypothetical protein
LIGCGIDCIEVLIDLTQPVLDILLGVSFERGQRDVLEKIVLEDFGGHGGFLKVRI